MTCRELTRAIGDFVDDELPVADRPRFESHLAACEACRSYVAGYRTTIAAVKSAHGADEPSPARVREVVDRALAAVGPKRPAKH